MRRSKRKTSSQYASAKPNKIGENKATHEENEENLWDAVPVVQPETAISSVQKMRRSNRKTSSPYASAKPNKIGENKATHEENEENLWDAVPVVQPETAISSGRNYIMADNPRTHTDEEEDDDDNVDSHGVKSFPRRRTHFSSSQQILGTEPHNDVFGMTIFQFEQEFTACLERRKQNEPQIMNIVFPNKTDNRYLEYLANTQIQQTDHTSLFSSNEKEIYNNLIRVVGSEMDIRIRQNMFLIKDKIYNKVHTTLTQVSSGSLAEGLDLPGSDMDEMLVFNYVQVIQNVQSTNRSSSHTILLMEDDVEFPGYTRLKLIAEGDHNLIYTSPECCVKDINGLFLSNILFLRKCNGSLLPLKTIIHGPSLSDQDKTIDVVNCFHLCSWPRQAKQWIYRQRPGQWPPVILIHEIVNYGCTLVPIGPREIENSELLWRISCTMAEKQLSHAMNYTQMLCYALLKLSLKNIIDRNDQAKDLLCSFFMKTAVFWLSEEIFINAFQLQNLFHCYCLCLDKIISWVKCCYCPNYFIPEHNMFRGKINRTNNRELLIVLESIRKDERGVFTVSTLFNCEAVLHESCAKLEVLFYKVIAMDFETEKGYALLSFIKSLSFSSSILSGICKYYYALANQAIVQKLPFPITNISNVRVIRCFHKHLRDGTKSDAVSGWLLYASFYYVLGQYNETLNIIDDVLSRCTPDMIMLSQPNYTTDDIEHYKQKVGCSNITLNDKMRLATMHNVYYVHQSTLIPHELKPEVQYCNFYVPPNIMSHCLRFLCYHHLHNIGNRKQSLYDIIQTIRELKFISGDELSNCFTILGVCEEIVGEKDAADWYYGKALQCEYRICPSAAKRKANLNLT